MVFRDDRQECRCKGTGVIKVKGTEIGVLCSCPVGKMIARNAMVFSRDARELAHG